MSSNYPPGVTGNEYEIAGPDYEEELPDERCPQCLRRYTMYAQGYRGTRWVNCSECGYQEERDPQEDTESWCCDAGPIGHGGRHWKED